MPKLIESNFFKGRSPLTGEDLHRLTLTGFSGAFRQLLADHNLDIERDVYMGTQVLVTSTGDIEGCKPVKCGIIPSVTLNIQEAWENAPHPGKFTIEAHDASIYGTSMAS